MNGSDDDGSYRYTMPALIVKREGEGKMKKTVLVNLRDVSQAVGRPADYLLTFLGQSLNVATKAEKEGDKRLYVTGHFDANVVQQHAITFVQEFVMCKQCKNPETSPVVEGKKRNAKLFLACGTCGKRRQLESTDKFVKYMLQHASPDPVRGHARTGRGATSDAVAMVSQLADAETGTEKKKDKQKCPNPRCGHNSSKDVCSKCGTAMDSGNLVVASSHEDDAPTVQLAAVIENIAEAVSNECAAVTENLQPAKVSEMTDMTSTYIEKVSVIKDLCAKIDSHDVRMCVIATSVWKAVSRRLVECTERTKETVVIGVLLCLQHSMDDITDEHVLSGCKKLPSCGVAMTGFMKFLESCSDEESDTE